MPALAVAAVLVAVVPHGNRIELKLDRGAAEVAWLSSSSFRFRRAFDGALPKITWADKDAVEVKIVETPAGVEFGTRHVTLFLSRRGLLARVRTTAGEALMEDLSEPVSRDGVLRFERAAEEGTRFFGLGPRAEMNLDLRGRRVRASTPLLISSAGFGEFHAAPGEYTFDLAATARDRYAVEARGTRLVDYCFYYGPAPKEVFEEHLLMRAEAGIAPADVVARGSWETLRDTILRMVQASMSGTAIPTFDLRPYLGAPEALRRRARQFGTVAPSLIFGNTSNIEDLRKRLKTFFATYELEVRDRGFPILHPLPFQFPSDARGDRHGDQFMVGDELLAAPIYTPSGRRSVYLPQGIWTELATGREYKGRQVIEIESNELPLFGRNGTILPLDPLKRGEPMVLHYFPKLGAEFFVLEPELADYTQVHAGPAADVMRLEIESKVARVYEWVVHHAGAPKALERPTGGETPKWTRDDQGSVHLRLSVRAGEDAIINLRLP
jgi:hypothetical protein